MEFKELQRLKASFDGSLAKVAKTAKSLTDNFNGISRPAFDNGLRVDIKDGVRDVIKMKAIVASGARHDPPDRPGTMHMIEHLSFYGTAERNQLEREFESRGGQINASIDFDEVTYEFSIPHSAKNEALLYHAAARILFDHRMDPDQLDHEKEVLTAEMIDKQDDYGAGLINNLNGQAFGIERFIERRGGSPESIEKMTVPDLQAFRQAHYVPANTRLELSGVSQDGAYRGLKKEMADQPFHPAPPPAPPLAYQGGWRDLGAENRQQTSVAIAFPLSPKTDFQVDNVMSKYISDALRARVRGTDDRRSYSFAASLSYFGGAGLMTMNMESRPDRAGALLPAVAAIMRDIVAGKVDNKIFSGAVTRAKRENAEYIEKTATDPRQTRNAMDRFTYNRKSLKVLRTLTPQALTDLAKNVMLAAPPTVVVAGDKTHLQSFAQFSALLGQSPTQTVQPKSTLSDSPA